MNQVYKIGRNVDNNLVLDDKLVEAFHANLYINDNNELVLIDLKSKYGTMVNGARVNEVVLREGDQVQIGFSKIEWLNIEVVLRASLPYLKEEVKEYEKINTEVETNYTGSATHQLALDAVDSKKETSAKTELSNSNDFGVNANSDFHFENEDILHMDEETAIEIIEAAKEPEQIEILEESNLTDAMQVADEKEVDLHLIEKAAEIKSKKSLDKIIKSTDKVYIYLLFMLLAMFSLGWIISIIT
jgi:hypothetical protein